MLTEAEVREFKYSDILYHNGKRFDDLKETCLAAMKEGKRWKEAWTRCLLRDEARRAENERLTGALAKCPCQAGIWKSNPCVCPVCQAKAELRKEAK